MEKFNSIHILFKENHRFLYYGDTPQSSVSESVDSPESNYYDALCSCPEVEDLVSQIEEQEDRIGELENQTLIDAVGRDMGRLTRYLQDQYESARTDLGEFVDNTVDGASDFVSEQFQQILELKQQAEQELAHLREECEQKLHDVAVLVGQGYHDILDAGLAKVDELKHIASWGTDQVMNLASRCIETGAQIPGQVKDILVQKGSEIASWGTDQITHYLGVMQELGEDAQQYVDALVKNAGRWSVENAMQILSACSELKLDAERLAIAAVEAGAGVVMAIANEYGQYVTREFWDQVAQNVGSWGDRQLGKAMDMAREFGKDASSLVDALVREKDRIVALGTQKGLELLDLATEFGQDAQGIAETIVNDISNWGEEAAQAVSDYIEQKGAEAKVLVEALVLKGQEVAKLALIIPALPFIILGAAIATGVGAGLLMKELAASATEWGEEQFDAAVATIKEYGDNAKELAEGLLGQGEALVELAVDKSLELYEQAITLGLGSLESTKDYVVRVVERVETWSSDQIDQAINIMKEKGAEAQVLAEAMLQQGEAFIKAGIDNALVLVDTAIGMGLEVSTYANLLVDGIQDWSDAQITSLTQIISEKKDEAMALARALEQKGAEVVSVSIDAGMVALGVLVGLGLDAQSYVVALVDQVEQWSEAQYTQVVDIINQKTDQAMALALALEQKGEQVVAQGVDLGLIVLDTLIGAGLDAQSYVAALIDSAENWTEQQVAQALVVINKYGEKTKAFAQGLVDKGEALVAWGGATAAEVIASAVAAGVEAKDAIVALADAGADFTLAFLEAAKTQVKDVPYQYFVALADDISNWTGEQAQAFVELIDRNGDKAKRGVKRAYKVASNHQQQWQEKGENWREGDPRKDSDSRVAQR